MASCDARAEAGERIPAQKGKEEEEGGGMSHFPNFFLYKMYTNHPPHSTVKSLPVRG